MTEHITISVNTRRNWFQWLPQQVEAEALTARMLELGISEFLRFRGAVTVEVVIKTGTRSRSMLWRGYEEIRIEQEVADNAGYVRSL